MDIKFAVEDISISDTVCIDAEKRLQISLQIIELLKLSDLLASIQKMSHRKICKEYEEYEEYETRAETKSHI